MIVEELKFKDEAVEVLSVIGELGRTQTQSIKLVLISKDGEKYLSLQKWWRKASTDPWIESKGFHLPKEEVVDLSGLLGKALALMN